jgi:predicted dehydrogenase
VLDNLFGEVKSVSCLGATHIPERVDEAGRRYQATADDAAYATFELASGVIVQMNSSWAVRVRRDDLVTFQVDGTHGSAVAGLQRCWSQARVNTPKPVWNPDIPQTIDFFSTWQEVPTNVAYDNAFKAEWELFIRHVCEDAPFRWNLLEGAKGVQLVECGLQSWSERRWVDIPALPA